MSSMSFAAASSHLDGAAPLLAAARSLISFSSASLCIMSLISDAPFLDPHLHLATNLHGDVLAQPSSHSNRAAIHGQDGLSVLVTHIVTGAHILLQELYHPHNSQIALQSTPLHNPTLSMGQ